MVTRRSLLVRIPSLAALLLLTLSSCQVPNFEGPQIQDPPRRFFLQEDSYQGRRMFPDREVTWHTAWIEAMNGPYSGIYINAHPGVMTVEDVADALDAAKLAAEHPATSFGSIEAFEIDGRTAWGWAERLETPRLGLDWVAYRAVVPYDTVTFAIEFYGGDPRIKLAAPDTLKTVIASFAIGETTWNLPLVALIVGVTLFGISVLRTRAKERTARLRSVRLVSVEDLEKKEEPEAAEDWSGAAEERLQPVGVGAPERSATGPPAPPAAPTELRRPPPLPEE